MVNFQNINALSGKDMDGMVKRFAKENATTITVVITPTGEITVLSPLSPMWTQHNLLTAGMGIQTGQAMN